MEKYADYTERCKIDVLRVLHERKTERGVYVIRIVRYSFIGSRYDPKICLEKRYLRITKNGVLRKGASKPFMYADLQILWALKDEIETWYRMHAPQYVEEWHLRYPHASEPGLDRDAPSA